MSPGGRSGGRGARTGRPVAARLGPHHAVVHAGQPAALGHLVAAAVPGVHLGGARDNWHAHGCPPLLLPRPERSRRAVAVLRTQAVSTQGPGGSCLLGRQTHMGTLTHGWGITMSNITMCSSAPLLSSCAPLSKQKTSVKPSCTHRTSRLRSRLRLPEPARWQPQTAKWWAARAAPDATSEPGPPC